jgi:RNA polymerase sigma-70 factor (ECF subfamily)
MQLAVKLVAMSSNAAPALLMATRSEPGPVRRPYLSVCRAPGEHGEPLAAPAPSDAPALGGAPEHAAPRESEIIAMLPALRRRAWQWCRDDVEAEDLVQETVLRAFGAGASFDSDGHVRAWLYTVLRNLFISRRRRELSAQRASAELGILAEAAGAATPPASFFTQTVQRALGNLPEAFARVVRLVDLEEHSYAEAAALLGIPVGTVMSRLFRGRKRLAAALGDSER